MGECAERTGSNINNNDNMATDRRSSVRRGVQARADKCDNGRVVTGRHKHTLCAGLGWTMHAGARRHGQRVDRHGRILCGIGGHGQDARPRKNSASSDTFPLKYCRHLKEGAWPPTIKSSAGPPVPWLKMGVNGGRQTRRKNKQFCRGRHPMTIRIRPWPSGDIGGRVYPVTNVSLLSFVNSKRAKRMKIQAVARLSQTFERGTEFESGGEGMGDLL